MLIRAATVSFRQKKSSQHFPSVHSSANRPYQYSSSKEKSTKKTIKSQSLHKKAMRASFKKKHLDVRSKEVFKIIGEEKTKKIIEDNEKSTKTALTIKDKICQSLQQKLMCTRQYYSTQTKKMTSSVSQHQNLSSFRVKTKSKMKKINECKIRKIKWPPPFEIEVSKIVKEDVETPKESLKDLCELLEEQ